MTRIHHLIAALAACLCLAACSPVTRHKVLTTIFEGVPSLPEPEQLCQDYADKQVQNLRDELAGKRTAGGKAASNQDVSVHRPYDEKKCDDCHDKSKEGGLVRPRKDLCLMCHVGFIKYQFVHGPTAVGDCLACHLPHTSNFPRLLKFDRGEICVSCHKEERLAASMHNQVGARKMACADCHDPHSGTSPYFLK